VAALQIEEISPDTPVNKKTTVLKESCSVCCVLWHHLKLNSTSYTQVTQDVYLTFNPRTNPSRLSASQIPYFDNPNRHANFKVPFEIDFVENIAN